MNDKHECSRINKRTRIRALSTRELYDVFFIRCSRDLLSSSSGLTAAKSGSLAMISFKCAPLDW